MLHMHISINTLSYYQTLVCAYIIYTLYLVPVCPSPLFYIPFRLGHIVFIEETVARRQVCVYVYTLHIIIYLYNKYLYILCIL